MHRSQVEGKIKSKQNETQIQKSRMEDKNEQIKTEMWIQLGN